MPSRLHCLSGTSYLPLECHCKNPKGLVIMLLTRHPASVFICQIQICEVCSPYYDKDLCSSNDSVCVSYEEGK